jgi:hypothetical protein
VLGVLFLALAAARRLNGPFPLFAGGGDIIAGVFAIPLALRAARSQKLDVSAITKWNTFGALNLLVAIGLGVTSAAGSPLQLVHARGWVAGDAGIAERDASRHLMRDALTSDACVPR